MIIKQVIVIRKDLKMRKGKMVAQGAHASMKAILDEGYANTTELGYNVFVIPMTTKMKSWLMGTFTKICVGVDSEEQLLEVYDKAKESGMPCSLILDNGLTEFGNVPTHTCVAIGPAKAEDIDKITGGLKLL